MLAPVLSASLAGRAGAMATMALGLAPLTHAPFTSLLHVPSARPFCMPHPHPLARPWPGLLADGLRAARFWRWLLLGLVLVVGWLALQPRPPASISLGWDKLNHGAAFAALAFSAWLGHAASTRRRGVVLLALWLYGALIEVAQTWLPPRQGDWVDLLGDTVGLVLGTALAVAVLRLLPPGAGRPDQRDGVVPRS